MDINTNTLRHTSAIPASLKIVNAKQSADPSVKNTDDSSRKAETPSESTGASTVAETKDKKDSDELAQAVNKLNDYVQNIQRDLQFSIDKESGIMVVKVIDAKSEKVIRQMPAEESLRLARNLVEQNDETPFNIFSSRA